MSTQQPNATARVQIDYPVELLDEMTPEQVRRLAQEAVYVGLYAQGKISSGHAGALLGITRSDFLDLLGRYGVSYFDPATDIAEDARAAEQARS